MADKSSCSSANSRPIQTLIPGQRSIELVAYYTNLAAHYRECELQTKRWFVENVHPDWILFDVGAHIGYYSILFSRLAAAGQIYAFEPTDTFFMLEKNLAHNACRNVKALQMAVGMISGPVEENVFRIWSEGPERYTYNFSTVDDLVQKLKLPRLDCIKIDVDSFDFEVLMGAEETLGRLNPWIVVELCHSLSRRGQSVTEALEWLLHRGYRKAHVVEHDNFVLHRDPSEGGHADGQSLLLTFEDRPVILQPAWIKDAPTENLFVSEPLAHNDARIVMDSGGRISIAAPGPRWAYAGSWRRRDDIWFDQPFLLELKMQVSGASIGLGCVSEDFAAYVTKEIKVDPGSDVQTISLYVESPVAARHLVLRNVDVAAHQALVVIYEFRCFAAAANPLC